MNRFRVAEERLPHFVTCSIVYWLPIFTAPRYFQIISDKRASKTRSRPGFRVDSLRHCREHKGLRLHAFVIMPTHLHLIGSAAEDPNLADLLRDFKKFTSRKISEQLRKDNQVRAVKLTRRAARASRHEQEHKVWQDGFHPETIYTEQFYLQKFDYLHANPCRKGFVLRPEDWLFSSARAYVRGDESVLKIDRLEVIKMVTGSETP